MKTTYVCISHLFKWAAAITPECDVQWGIWSWCDLFYVKKGPTGYTWTSNKQTNFGRDGFSSRETNSV